MILVLLIIVFETLLFMDLACIGALIACVLMDQSMDRKKRKSIRNTFD